MVLPMNFDQSTSFQTSIGKGNLGATDQSLHSVIGMQLKTSSRHLRDYTTGFM